MKRLAVSVGCPCGVGPEVSVVAASKLAPAVARALLVGDEGVLVRAARVTGVAASRLVVVASAEEAWSLGRASRAIPVLEPCPPLAAAERRFGAPGRAAGRAELAWIDAAADLASSGAADALVTGPVSKDAIARSGAPGSRGFLGHTEHLAARLGAREVTMAFYDRGGITTSLVTTHLPLAAVPRAIDRREVARAAFWTAWLLARVKRAKRGTKRARVAVASLNPHAGEHGLLGDDERRAIAPGIALARTRIARAGLAVDLVGPVPAESAFRLAKDGVFDAVVAMYHDQATIPMKLLGFGASVNVTLGLPIVRTSVDHGTAYDRAGKGTADPRGMIEAMRLAVVLSADARAPSARPTRRSRGR